MLKVMSHLNDGSDGVVYMLGIGRIGKTALAR